MARLDKRREVVVFEEQEDDEAIELRFYDVVKKGTGEFDFTGWQCNNKVEYWIRSQFCQIFLRDEEYKGPFFASEELDEVLKQY